MLRVGPQVGPFPSRPTKGSIRGEGTPPTNPSRHLKKERDHPSSQVAAQGGTRRETNRRQRRRHRHRTTTCRRRARRRGRRLPLPCSLVFIVLPSGRRRRCRRLRPPLPPPPPDRSTTIPSPPPSPPPFPSFQPLSCLPSPLSLSDQIPLRRPLHLPRFSPSPISEFFPFVPTHHPTSPPPRLGSAGARHPPDPATFPLTEFIHDQLRSRASPIPPVIFSNSPIFTETSSYQRHRPSPHSHCLCLVHSPRNLFSIPPNSPPTHLEPSRIAQTPHLPISESAWIGRDAPIFNSLPRLPFFPSPPTFVERPKSASPHSSVRRPPPNFHSLRTRNRLHLRVRSISSRFPELPWTICWRFQAEVNPGRPEHLFFIKIRTRNNARVRHVVNS